ncbi:MAG: extracellular solute-binding protein [Roseburia sp.]|nr:extracellular solute-binding protein [Roseburia sp.]
MNRKALLLAAALLLTGCGATKDSEEPGETPGDTQEEVVVEAVSREPYDILTNQWKDAGEPAESTHWWAVADYVDNVVQPQEGEESIWWYYAVDGSDFYAINAYYIYEDEKRENLSRIDYYLHHLDGDSMKTDSTLISEQETFSGMIMGLDAAGGRLMTFVQDWDAEGETSHYYGAFLNTDGTWGETVDLFPALEACGLRPEPNYALAGGKWDSQGYFYFSDDYESEVYIIDETGEMIETLGGRDGRKLDSKCKSPEGIRIWEEENTSERTVTYFYYGENGIHELYKGPYSLASERVVNSYGDIIFVNQSNVVVRWNVATGSYEKLYMGNGMETKRCAGIMQNKEGKIILVNDEGDRLSVNSLSESGPTRKADLILAVTSYCDYQTKSNVKEFVRKHPGVTIEIQETEWDDREASWNRMLADLTAGKGPDMILLSREEMLVLQEKGVLADLSEVLPAQMQEQVFQGVLDYGRVGEALYGLTYSAGFSTLMVSRETWSEDTWRMEDVLEILEEREAGGNPSSSFQNVWWQEGGQTREQLFFSIMGDLDHSSLLDLEKGECYFDSDTFKRLLEVCKRCGEEGREESGVMDDGTKREQRNLVKEGYALAYAPFTSTLADFSEDMAALGEDYHCVGSPTEGESGNYWLCSGTMAVNAGTDNREVIDELLRYLYSEECQKNSLQSNLIVRRDLLINSVVEHVDWSSKPMQRMDAYSWVELMAKPDGSSYLEEYLELLESCVVATNQAAQIQRIISEEVPAWFQGDKDAETVADIIQKRAQLYLDEGNL